MNNLAGLSGLPAIRRASLLLEETLALRKAKLGPDHPDTLISMNNLAISYPTPGGTTGRCRSSRRRWRYEGEARARPPRHTHQHEQPRHSYQAAGQPTGPCSSSRRRWRCRRRSSAPTTPTRSLAIERQAQGLANSGKLDRAGRSPTRSSLATKGPGRRPSDHVPVPRLARADLDLAPRPARRRRGGRRAILDECRAVRQGQPQDHDRRRARPGPGAGGAGRPRLGRDRARQGTALESARKNPTDRETLATCPGGVRPGRVLRRRRGPRQRRCSARPWRSARPRCPSLADSRDPLAAGRGPAGPEANTEAVPLLRSGYEGMARSPPRSRGWNRPRLAEALDRLIAAGAGGGRGPKSRHGRPSGRSADAGGPKP